MADTSANFKLRYHLGVGRYRHFEFLLTWRLGRQF